jgi:hypothetical protein
MASMHSNQDHIVFVWNSNIQERTFNEVKAVNSETKISAAANMFYLRARCSWM